jgi:hypothetical protein
MFQFLSMESSTNPHALLNIVFSGKLLGLIAMIMMCFTRNHQNEVVKCKSMVGFICFLGENKMV